MIHAHRCVDLRGYISLILPLLVVGLFCVSCSKKKSADTGKDEKVTTLGSMEVTAKLVEIKGELPDDPMYDCAFVLKYTVMKVHRGKIDTDTIYVGQYNPLKPRAEVADARVTEIGGNLKKFRAGDVHRMALEVPIDDYYMGGIVNRYFEEKTGPIYWAVWTNQGAE
ncbi:MAG: hypothetical protein ACYTF1_17170 [Planctomycetota bacterium]|jgi:hypothetical protein